MAPLYSKNWRSLSPKKRLELFRGKISSYGSISKKAFSAINKTDEEIGKINSQRRGAQHLRTELKIEKTLTNNQRLEYLKTFLFQLREIADHIIAHDANNLTQEQLSEVKAFSKEFEAQLHDLNTSLTIQEKNIEGYRKKAEAERAEVRKKIPLRKSVDEFRLRLPEQKKKDSRQMEFNFGKKFEAKTNRRRVV